MCRYCFLKWCLHFCENSCVKIYSYLDQVFALTNWHLIKKFYGEVEWSIVIRKTVDQPARHRLKGIAMGELKSNRFSRRACISQIQWWIRLDVDFYSPCLSCLLVHLFALKRQSSSGYLYPKSRRGQQKRWSKCWLTEKGGLWLICLLHGTHLETIMRRWKNDSRMTFNITGAQRQSNKKANGAYPFRLRTQDLWQGFNIADVPVHLTAKVFHVCTSLSPGDKPYPGFALDDRPILETPLPSTIEMQRRDN